MTLFSEETRRFRPDEARSVAVFMCGGFDRFPVYLKKTRELFPNGELTIIGKESRRSAAPADATYVSYPNEVERFNSGMMKRAGLANTTFDVFVVPGFTGFESHFNIIDVAVRVAMKAVTIIRPGLEYQITPFPVFDAEFPAHSVTLRHRFLRREILNRPPNDIAAGIFVAHPYYGYVYAPNSTIDHPCLVSNRTDIKCVAQTDRRGFRNAVRPEKKEKREYWIGLFGGSVAFSAGATSNETSIAGFLEAGLNKRLHAMPKRRVERVRVFNFGQGAGHQPMQTHVFIGNHRELDAAITFDGHNEIMAPLANRFRLPMDFPLVAFYRSLFARGVTEEQIALTWFLKKGKKWMEGLPPLVKPLFRFALSRIQSRVSARLNRQSDFESELVSVFGEGRDSFHENIRKFLEACAEDWIESMRIMRLVCEGLGKESLFVLQPLIENGKPLSEDERAIQEEVGPELRKLLLMGRDIFSKRLAAFSTEGANTADFWNVFDGVTDTIYWDNIHFFDRGNEIVAEKLSDMVLSTFKPFVTG